MCGLNLQIYKNAMISDFGFRISDLFDYQGDVILIAIFYISISSFGNKKKQGAGFGVSLLLF